MWSIILDIHDIQRERPNSSLLFLLVHAKTSLTLDRFKLVLLGIEQNNGSYKVDYQIVVTEPYLNQNRGQTRHARDSSVSLILHKAKITRNLFVNFTNAI